MLRLGRFDGGFDGAQSLPITLAIAAPAVLAIQFHADSLTVRLVALLWGVLLVLVAWLLGRSQARRITRLTDFADRLLSQDAPPAAALR